MSKKTSPADNPQKYAQTLKGKKGLKRLFNATQYSKDGLLAAYKNEAAFRQILWINTILFGLIYICPFGITIKMILIFSSFLSIIVELFNTGLEAAIDHTSTEKHPLAKIGKDVGSAAQLLALTLQILLWILAISTCF